MTDATDTETVVDAADTIEHRLDPRVAAAMRALVDADQV